MPSLNTSRPLGPVTLKMARDSRGFQESQESGSVLVLGASCWREGQGPGCNLSLAGGYPQVRAEGTLGVGSLIQQL